MEVSVSPAETTALLEQVIWMVIGNIRRQVVGSCLADQTAEGMLFIWAKMLTLTKLSQSVRADFFAGYGRAQVVAKVLHQLAPA